MSELITLDTTNTTPAVQPSLKPNNVDEWFDLFWHYYPRRQNKAGAKRVFKQIVAGKHRDIDQTEPRPLAVGAYRLNRHVEIHRLDKQYLKLPTTWLNNGCWDDELVAPAPSDICPSQSAAPSTKSTTLTQDLTDRSWAK